MTNNKIKIFVNIYLWVTFHIMIEFDFEEISSLSCRIPKHKCSL
jgi:hypothetical protein